MQRYKIAAFPKPGLFQKSVDNADKNETYSNSEHEKTGRRQGKEGK